MHLIAAPLPSPCLRGNLGGRNCQDAESFVRDFKRATEPSKTAGKPV
jgi:hypothetical protein